MIDLTFTLDGDYMAKPNPLAWEDHFPPVYGHTSISFLKQCPSFHEAKHGDMHAAIRVVNKCVNLREISYIRENYPDAILLPVISNNKLPEALAKMIGLKTCTEVCALSPLRRKSLSAMERLLHKPSFCGDIIKGKNYVIVDDIVTQGGTVSELRKHVINHGGNVSAIATLSYSIGSNILAPNQEDIYNLIKRFNLLPITNTLKNYDIAYDVRELTRSQLRYLLLFKELEGLIEKIKKTQNSTPMYTS